MSLKQLIDQQKQNSFNHPELASDAEALGIMIAHHFQWGGQEIFDTLQAAFEDANYHTFNGKVAEAWEQDQARDDIAERRMKMDAEEIARDDLEQIKAEEDELEERQKCLDNRRTEAENRLFAIQDKKYLTNA